MLRVEVPMKVPTGPTIVLSRNTAGSESTGIAVDISANVIVAKMFPDLLASLEAFTRAGWFETTVMKRTECIIFMLRLSNMLQPFVLPSKGSGLRGTRIVWAFPRALRGVLRGIVSLKLMLVFEWPLVGAVAFGA